MIKSRHHFEEILSRMFCSDSNLLPRSSQLELTWTIVNEESKQDFWAIVSHLLEYSSESACPLMQYISHWTDNNYYGNTIIICAANTLQREIDIIKYFNIIGLHIFLSLNYNYIDCFVFVFYKVSVPPVRTLFKLQSGTVTLSVTDIC